MSDITQIYITQKLKLEVVSLIHGPGKVARMGLKSRKMEENVRKIYHFGTHRN